MRVKCSIDGCDNVVRHLGWCNAHHLRWLRYGNPLETRQHRQTGTPEHQAWIQIRSRCTNQNLRSFKDYGGREISVCARWDSFENFLADMGKRPSAKHSIDRFPDNDGNYEPGNCRWATKKEQGRNRRTTKLNDDAVSQIKLLLSQGVFQEKIALRFGVCRSLISLIKSGARWA